MINKSLTATNLHIREIGRRAQETCKFITPRSITKYDGANGRSETSSAVNSAFHHSQASAQQKFGKRGNGYRSGSQARLWDPKRQGKWACDDWVWGIRTIQNIREDSTLYTAAAGARSHPKCPVAERGEYSGGWKGKFQRHCEK